MLRHLARRILEPQVCAVVEAADGEEGLRAVERAHPEFDLVLTDLEMPVMDGWTVIAALSRYRPDLPILCMSGYSRIDQASRLARYPAVPLLSKPFTADALAAAVSDTLDRGRQVRASAKLQREMALEARAMGRRLRQENEARHSRAIDLVVAAHQLRSQMRGD